MANIIHGNQGKSGAVNTFEWKGVNVWSGEPLTRAREFTDFTLSFPNGLPNLILLRTKGWTDGKFYCDVFIREGDTYADVGGKTFGLGPRVGDHPPIINTSVTFNLDVAHYDTNVYYMEIY